MRAPAPPASVMHLARVERFAEFRRPMPVDRQFADPRHASAPGAVPPMMQAGGHATPPPWDPTVPVEFGLHARAHIGVLDYHRGDFTLAAYQRSPWTTLKIQTRSLWMRALFFEATAGGRPLDVTVNDDGSVARTLAPVGPGNAGVLFNNSTPFSNAELFFKYGSNGGAVAGTENNVRTQLGLTFGGDYAYDDTLFRVNASGSRVHTEANATIREIAQFQNYADTGNLKRQFMADLTVVADTAVTTNQTVAVSYQYQF